MGILPRLIHPRGCSFVSKLFISIALATGLFYILSTHAQRYGRFVSQTSDKKVLDYKDAHARSGDWTKIIWQTSKIPAEELDGEVRQHYGTWQALNPDYEHVVMTDERMAQYVREKYGGTEFEEMYFELQDYILLSDLIRYLILLHDGGVYNDLDVGCEKPIDQWVPKDFVDDAGVILGVEVDNKFGPDGRTFQDGEDLFELVNWTIMAKPNQPFMSFLVRRVFENLRAMAEHRNTTLRHLELTSIQEVLETTGPGALTQALFDYATNITGFTVTYKALSKILDPVLIGEVLILPIHAFGAGHQVEWAGFEKDQSKVLVHHYFSGSWYADHAWSPQASSQSSQQRSMDRG